MVSMRRLFCHRSTWCCVKLNTCCTDIIGALGPFMSSTFSFWSLFGAISHTVWVLSANNVGTRGAFLPWVASCSSCLRYWGRFILWHLFEVSCDLLRGIMLGRTASLVLPRVSPRRIIFLLAAASLLVQKAHWFSKNGDKGDGNSNL